MSGLEERDIRLLKRSFLEALNEMAEGDYEKCLDRAEVFRVMGKRAYSEEVIPFIIQFLKEEGTIEECEHAGEVRITLRGRQSLTRTTEQNAFQLLSELMKRRQGLGEVSSLHMLSNNEFNDALTYLKELGYVTLTGKDSISPDGIILSEKAILEYQNLEKPSSGLRTKEWKKYFISRPYGTDTSVIDYALSKRGLRSVEEPGIGYSGVILPQRIIHYIKEADVIIAVIKAYKDKSLVYYELGLATALNKPSLLLVSPDCDDAFPFRDFEYVRSDEKNEWAINFGLDQVLSNPSESVGSQKSFKSTKPLGRSSIDYLAFLEERGDKITEADLESLIKRILHASEISVISQPVTKDFGPDIVVWSDDLEQVVGNPLVIEIKKSVSPSSIRAIAYRLANYIDKVKCRYALLLYLLGPQPESLRQLVSQNILIERADNMISQLESRSFAQVVFNMRKMAYKGVGVP